jgi:DNA invertase Pin-like site-specific DNA recombinase
MVARQNRRKWQPGDRPPMTSERAKWVRSHVKNPGVGKGAAQLAITKSKLRDKADKIRNDFKSWKSSKYQFELKTADEYGVSRSTITRILKKELY